MPAGRSQTPHLVGVVQSGFHAFRAKPADIENVPCPIPAMLRQL